jgi:hypothetical protein
MQHSRLASLSVEEKEARRARRRVHDANNRDAINAAERKRRANMKLDPVKYKAYRQKENERDRKRYLKLKAERVKRARAAAEGDDDDDEKSSAADKQSAIPRDNIVVISDDEGEHAVEVADDSSGSDVEGIEFVSSDDEQ